MNLDTRPNIDWDSLGFNVTETKSMFHSTCIAGEKWSGGELIPYGDISMSPFAGVLNYGQGVFEGIKAFRSPKGHVGLFRADMNGKRMAFSTQRICMPEMDPDFFMDALIKTVKDNIEYIPPYRRGSLYIRPVVWGTAPILGVSPTSEYTFMVIVSPVGPYFKEGIKPLNLKITTDYQRAAPKGVGNAKAIGNYSASLFSLMEAKAEGFDENIYLDAKDENFVEELGSANVFIYKDGVLKTPALNGSILGGITRQSVCQIASDILGIKVKETAIPVDDLLNAEEVFCTGTAVVVTPVGKMTYQEKTTIINQNQIGPIANKIRKILVGIQRGEIEDPFGWVLRVS